MNDSTTDAKVDPENMFTTKTAERTSKGSTSSNGSTNSTASSPLETQAKEKLALYVYEYLLHQGATRAAQTFLSEIQWEKNISLGDPPGFLHSWWCVFWDLYCAAPERQEPHNHSPEAKAFHDLNSGNLPSPSYIPPGDMSSMAGLQTGYFQHSRPPNLSNAQTSPHQAMMHGPFINNRYTQGRPGMRMTNQGMGPGAGQSPYSLDPTRQPQAPGPYQASSMMNAMRSFGNGMPPVPPNYNRLSTMSNGSMMTGGGMGPTTMPMAPRPNWSSPTTPGPLTPIQQDPGTQFGIEPPDAVKLEPRESIDEMPTETNESAEIQRIKESMKEEVKKFEAENTHVSEFYNMH